jgi:hypothetical protein
MRCCAGPSDSGLPFAAAVAKLDEPNGPRSPVRGRAGRQGQEGNPLALHYITLRLHMGWMDGFTAAQNSYC